MVFWELLKLELLTDGRKVSEIKTRGQQVYLNGLDIPVFFVMGMVKTRRKKGSTFCNFH